MNQFNPADYPPGLSDEDEQMEQDGTSVEKLKYEDAVDMNRVNAFNELVFNLFVRNLIKEGLAEKYVMSKIVDQNGKDGL